MTLFKNIINAYHYAMLASITNNISFSCHFHYYIFIKLIDKNNYKDLINSIKYVKNIKTKTTHKNIIIEVLKRQIVYFLLFVLTFY